MAVSESKLKEVLIKSFPNAKIIINDLVGDQDHYSVDITSEVFNNLPLIRQHKLVKESLSDMLKKNLHAITIKTRSK